MVAFSENLEIESENPPRVRAQNHTYRSGAERCSNLSGQANLRGVTYDEFEQLESCSRDPIGYYGWLEWFTQ